MKENAILKINKMGKAGAIIALVMKIILGIAVGATTIGLIATLVLPADLVKVKMKGTADVLVNVSAFGDNLFDGISSEELNKQVKKSTNISYGSSHFDVSDIQANGSEMSMKANGTLTEFNLRTCTWAILGGLINLVLLLVGTIFAGRLAKAFRDCKSPFEEDVIKKMKAFAYSLIPWAVVSGIVAFIEKSIWVSGSSNFTLNIDLTVVIIVLVILAFAYIFQYGGVLQKESDETL